MTRRLLALALILATLGLLLLARGQDCMDVCHDAGYVGGEEAGCVVYCKCYGGSDE